MSEIIQPQEFIDFRRGLIRKTSVDAWLTPANSVSHSVNLNYETQVGNAVVRSGTTKLGATVASGKNPLGLAEFRSAGGGINNLIAVYSNTSNGTIYYYDTSWHTSTTFDGAATALSRTAKHNFATLGNKLFMVNGVQLMYYSTDGGNNWTGGDSNLPATITPSVISRAKGRLLVGGDTTTAANRNRSRVWFSSVVDSSGATSAITWDVTSTGNWIDINPDDGDEVTAIADTSAVTLVFKNNYTYRLFSISKTVDPDPLFNFGVPSQQAVTICQGIVYFYTGKDIRRTNGSDTSEKISRYVDEIVQNIPQANWSKVSAFNDGVNVYFSFGNITLPSDGAGTGTGSKVDSRTYNNAVLKFSTQDESWSFHNYGGNLAATPNNGAFANFTITGSGSNNGRQILGADVDGNVQMYNVGKTDNGTAINFLMESQEIYFTTKAHLKAITDNFVVYTTTGLDSQIQIQVDNQDFSSMIFQKANLNERVSICRNINLRGNSIIVRWIGNSTQSPPIFEGFFFETVRDLGLVEI